MEVHTYRWGEFVVIGVTGEVDLFTASQLRERLTETMHRQEVNVILDYSALTFMDSSGVGVLVGALQRAQALGGSLRLACPPALVERKLHTTGLHTVLPTYPTVSAAAAAPLGEPDSPEPETPGP